jgi:hypothetical protein
MSVMLGALGITSFTLSTESQFNNNAYNLASLIERAKTTAMAQNTFVWLGFYQGTSNGSPVLYVGLVSAKNGQLTDLPNSIQPVSKVISFQNMTLQTGSYPQLPGMASGAVDVANTTTFSLQLPGSNAPVSFVSAIAFGPDGEIRISNTSVTRYISIGLQSGPTTATKHFTAELQLTGLSGQVAVFR